MAGHCTLGIDATGQNQGPQHINKFTTRWVYVSTEIMGLMEHLETNKMECGASLDPIY